MLKVIKLFELKILIAGIGDLLRKDDGFGPRVIKKLEELKLPDNVTVRDYGTSCLDLIFDLKDFDKVIFVDAVDFDGKAGEIRIVEPKARKMSEEEVIKSINMSLHEIELQKIIDLAYSLNVLPEKVLVIGCKPKDLNFGLDLSKEVAKAVKKAVKIILEKIVFKG
jgi:hydrogenase maturation protease